MASTTNAGQRSVNDPTGKGKGPPSKATGTKATSSKSRTETVHLAMRQAIIEQRLQPGEKLPEDAIGDAFGTSRTIAREALGRLAVEGLVELKQNRGAFVANPSLDEGRDTFFVRRGLERLVVEAIIGRLRPEDAERLRAFVAHEKSVSGTNDVESIRLAGEFHLLLAELTDNALLMRYVVEVVSRCSLVLAMYARPHSSECGVNEHEEITEALIAGDADTAMRLMDEHLSHVASRALLEAKGTRDIRDILSAYAPQHDDNGSKR
ncbi:MULTISPECIES: GntR family transcriptional regulator [unclassified Aureimonas]|uniref:GntR family transcriptional regulator n=1 Tax=unclassified Aureimonas TaxID=2615206 RepID=UPI0009EC61E9|nr:MULTISPECIES: GntR family transcriptional regulator [unclassified Aureimonas]